MAFRKYPSIENTYRDKEIQWWLRQFPELALEEFVIQEKLHGANFCLEFKPSGEWFAAKRTSRIGTGDGFYDAWGILARKEYTDFINAWVIKAAANDCTYHLHGELFGGNIQKGVNYGPEKRIAFFDLRKDEVMQPPMQFVHIMTEMHLEDFLVPILGSVDGLQDALDYDINFNSHECPLEVESDSGNPDASSVVFNQCEGIVIKPLNKVYITDQGHTFMLKKKSDAFKEKQQSKKNKKAEEVAPHVQRLREEMESYLTKERLQGIFSKEGEIQKPSQMGDYIRFLMADAREDFLKDHRKDIISLGKKEKNYIFNVGKVIVDMLKEYL